MKIDFSKTNVAELAASIYEILKDNQIEAVLVGGACVSIYSHNRYQSYDLDFVSYEGLKSIENVLSKHGFKRTGETVHFFV
jgi:predicted nucleotidyltransferase